MRAIEFPRAAVSASNRGCKMAKQALKTKRPVARVKRRAVLVTTEFRGVFFGFASKTGGDQITLENARNCIYWPSTQGGFGGLASEGPKKGSRIGAVVEKIDLRKVTSVVEVTKTAEAAWQSAETYRG